MTLPILKGALTLRLHPSRRIEDMHKKTIAEVGLKDKSHIFFKIRPQNGDHIHQAYAIVIGGKVIPPLMDQRHFKAIDDVPYVEEEKGEIEGGVYQKVYLHTGIHTHRDNLIHEHPWSSPFWFTFSEGLGSNFGQFMQSVDILYRQYPHEFSLEFAMPPYPEKFPGKTKFANGDIIDGKPCIWRLAFWPDHNNPDVKEIYTKDFDRVWLGYNMGMITLQFGPADEAVRVTPHEIIEFMMAGTFPDLKGFDGEPYPTHKDSLP